jgi:cytochrome c1
MTRPRATHLLSATALTALLAVAAVGCGGNDGDGGENGGGGAGGSAVPTAPGTAGGAGGAGDAAAGEQIARSSGCAGCHGQDFQGAAGPTWVGLAGSQVTLTDGSTVVADDAYLARAISDPAAELVDGFSLKMPANDLDDAEVADIVAYIKSLDGG